MKKIFSEKYFIFSIALSIFVFAGNITQAKNKDNISVFHADGTTFSARPLIFETNILPGDVFEKGFYIIKKRPF